MKKSYFGLLLAALVTLASCNKEMEGPNGPAAGVEDDGNSVYLSVALNLPTANSAGTRSSTENDDENTSNGTGDPDGKTPSDATNDYEVGWDYENEVSSLILVIADNDDNFLLHSVVNALPPTQQNGTDPTLYDVTGTAKFSRNALKQYYDDGTVGGSANKEIHLYAFCNYTSALEEYFSTIATGEKVGTYTTTPFTTNGTNSWLNKALALAETANGGVTGSIWGKRSFLMTNAEITKAYLPETIEKWNNYTSESTPYQLSGDNSTNDDPNNPEMGGGPIKVERAAARFDFKDVTSEETPATYPLTGNYSIVKEDNVVKEDVNLFTIQLTDMSLVNMSNGYFALRRVSNDGTQDAGVSTTPDANRYWRIGKYETVSNYVVDTDFEFKKTAGGNGKVTATELNTHFNFPLFTVDDEHKHTRNSTDIYAYNRTAWSTTSIQTLLNSKETDKWNNRNEYKIWRYVTENTIPKAEAENEAGSAQKAGLSTGIVFTGKIMAGEDIDAVYAQNGDKSTTQRFVSDAVKKLLADPNPDKPLYLFNGLLYASFSEIVKAAFNDGPGSRAHNVVSDILKYWYLEYENETYTPSAIGGNFVYSATEPTSTDGKKYLPLTVEIYYAITQATTEFDEVLKDGAAGNRGENGENVWKAEDSFHKGFVTNKEHYKFDTGVSRGEDTIDEAAIEFVDLAVKNLTIYRATTLDDTAPLGYYCYYFYWNRHNDNGNNSLMGNMEFATVRNNVYKLSVTKVGRLGHPTIPTDDPDPIIPDTPDEDDDIYMSVEIEVLPWVVRVNNIEF